MRKTRKIQIYVQGSKTPPSLSKLAYHSQFRVPVISATKTPKCVTPFIDLSITKHIATMMIPNRGSSLIYRFVILRSPGLSSDRLSVAMAVRQTITTEMETDKLHLAFNMNLAFAISSSLGFSSGGGVTPLRTGCWTMKTTATPRMRVA